ncbi:MAG: hypothetical protein ACRD0G_08605, partial [Acidimicrobiales bacterium]
MGRVAGLSGVPEELTQRELALVLRRAAQLEAAATTPELQTERLPVAAVEAAAAEAGLEPAAVRRAIAELRAGLLDEVESRPPSPDRLVVSRLVPGDQGAVSATIRRFLSGQLMHPVRDRGGVQVWRRRDDFLAGVRRLTDWGGSLKLEGLREVVVRTVPVESGLRGPNDVAGVRGPNDVAGVRG